MYFFIYFAVNKVCPQLPDGLFQSRTVSFWGRNVSKIVVKFCDTEINIGKSNETPDIFCKKRDNGLTIFDDKARGRTEEVQKLEIFVFTHSMIITCCKIINTGFLYANDEDITLIKSTFIHFQRTIESPSNQKFTLNYWNPVTAVKITIFPSENSETMSISFFNIYACCNATRPRKYFVFTNLTCYYSYILLQYFFKDLTLVPRDKVPRLKSY